MKLAVIIGTDRPGRVTPNMAKWIKDTAAKMDGVQPEMVDIKDYPLPFMNETMSPKYNPDRQPAPEVKKWMNKIAEFDAYMWVTPEYNHSVPGVLKNAIDYLTFELVRKPSTIAAHGSVSGARAIMHLREIFAELATPVIGTIGVPGFPPVITEEGELEGEAAANPHGPQFHLDNLLSDLKWYSDALAAARAQS